MKIAVVTDSSAGFKKEEIIDDLYIVPMPFMINNIEYYEEENMDSTTFYELIGKENVCVSTSQPSSYKLDKFFDFLFKTYDEILYIPLSKGLSAAYESSLLLSNTKYKGKLFVVDNQRVSVTLKLAVFDAFKLIKEGKTSKEVKEYLEKTKLDASIYIMIDRLDLLVKGGRVTPKAKALAGLLNIKPILQIQGGKLDAYKKVISKKLAKKVLIDAVESDLENRFKDYRVNGKMVLAVAHTNALNEALKLKEMLQKRFKDLKVLLVDNLALMVACHTDKDALGVAAIRIY